MGLFGQVHEETYLRKRRACSQNEDNDSENSRVQPQQS